MPIEDPYYRCSIIPDVIPESTIEADFQQQYFFNRIRFVNMRLLVFRTAKRNVKPMGDSIISLNALIHSNMILYLEQHFVVSVLFNLMIKAKRFTTICAMKDLFPVLGFCCFWLLLLVPSFRNLLYLLFFTLRLISAHLFLCHSDGSN